MKKLILLATLMAGFSAQADCFTQSTYPSDPAASETSRTITVGTLEMKFWKTACTESTNVGLVTKVSNYGYSSKVFDFTDLTFNGYYVSGDPITIGGRKYTIIWFEDTAKIDLRNTSTEIVYNGGLSTTLPAYSGGVAATTINSVAGLWYDRNLDGLGFNFIHNANGLFVYYYGYEDDGDALWLVTSSGGPAVGTVVAGQTYTINLNEPTDGNGADFNTKPNTAASGTSDWGTLTITFDSCNSATATLSGADGTQDYNLSKLAENSGTVCN